MLNVFEEHRQASTPKLPLEIGFPEGLLKGHHAFVPYVLPPKFAWNNRLVNSLSRTDFLLGKLAREGSRLPNPHLLIRPFITRDAVLSSKIEGTQATLGKS
ncbi:hypothetical protein FPG78_01550 [Cardinium endosymbiont of Dermatophagoides farinae]|nr:hypothetical protein FPG78_01550 [Cardinium endosymbiont of Dermatophagoides farinae]